MAGSEVSIIYAPLGSRYYPLNSGKGEYEHPHLKYRPEEIAIEIKEFFEEGLISQVHLHGRNPENGFPTGKPEHYNLLLQSLHRNLSEIEYYLSITTTDNNIPQQDKEIYGDMARAAILKSSYELLQPNKIPLIDSLAASLQAKNTNRPEIAEQFNDFIDNCLAIMDTKNIGFEIEIPKDDLFEVAKKFLKGMRGRLLRNEFNSPNLIASINAPVIQMLYGARPYMPSTEEFIRKSIDKVHNELSPRVVQVAFRHNRDQFNPDIARYLISLAKQGKIQGIRIGIEDTPKNMAGEFVSNQWLVEQINQIAKKEGVSIRKPKDALALIVDNKVEISNVYPQKNVINKTK